MRSVKKSIGPVLKILVLRFPDFSRITFRLFKPLLPEKLIIKLKNFKAHVANIEPVKQILTVQELIQDNFINLSPIKMFHSDCSSKRLNILLDSLDTSSIFGGVMTSLVFATLLANRIKIPLRIITRNRQSQLNIYWKLCNIHRLSHPKDVTLINFPYDDKHSHLEVSENDIFISTSWWSSNVIKKINLQKKYIYILQEYESIFYPNGDERVMAEEIFNDENCIPIVNTKILFEFFKNNGYKHIEKTNLFFEPAFPQHLYKPLKTLPKKNKEKLRLFFYARPGHARNLFYTGLNLIDVAIERNILKSDEWEIVFAGSEVPEFTFCDGSKPKMLGKMNLTEFCDYIPSVDLAICLMYAPCPSYLPLDFASVGTAVLTNKYLNNDASIYSKNIISMNSTESDLLLGLKEAILLAQDPEKRFLNFSDNTICQSWDNSLEHVLDRLQKIFSNHIKEHMTEDRLVV